VILLGTAVWFLERILPADVAMALWGVLALITAALGLNAVRHASLAEPARALFAALALVVGVWGGLMLGGAAGGGSDLRSPLAPYVGGGTPIATEQAEEGWPVLTPSNRRRIWNRWWRVPGSGASGRFWSSTRTGASAVR